MLPGATWGYLGLPLPKLMKILFLMLRTRNPEDPDSQCYLTTWNFLGLVLRTRNPEDLSSRFYLGYPWLLLRIGDPGAIYTG